MTEENRKSITESLESAARASGLTRFSVSVGEGSLSMSWDNQGASVQLNMIPLSMGGFVVSQHPAAAAHLMLRALSNADVMSSEASELEVFKAVQAGNKLQCDQDRAASLRERFTLLTKKKG